MVGIGRAYWGIAMALGAVLSAACGSDDGSAPRNSDLGGASLLSTDLRCKADSDCNSGEACGGGVCQMKRCGEANYASISPLGTMGYFKRDRELVVVGDGNLMQ